MSTPSMVARRGWVTVVGSRETPDMYVAFLKRYTQQCVALGFSIRTGDARTGGDHAARQGAIEGDRVIYTPVERNRPYHTAGPSLPLWEEALTIARSLHPAGIKRFDTLTPFVQALHARNIFQVLGDTLNEPSEFMMFYAPIIDETTVTGGTNTAFQVAREWGIPSFNLNCRDQTHALERHLQALATPL